MFRQIRQASAIRALILTVVLLVTAALPAAAASPDALQELRAATAKYHSLAQAAADGYLMEGEPCIEAPGLGAMGFHAANPALVGDSTSDPLQPDILLYAPDANGKLKLVAVEYLVFDADQDLSTDDDRPSIFGQSFDGPMPGHNPFMPVHYDLHIWLWADNPAGTFAPFNPSLSCGT